jgi:hypothetical protein
MKGNNAKKSLALFLSSLVALDLSLSLSGRSENNKKNSKLFLLPNKTHIPPASAAAAALFRSVPTIANTQYLLVGTYIFILGWVVSLPFLLLSIYDSV